MCLCHVLSLMIGGVAHLTAKGRRKKPAEEPNAWDGDGHVLDTRSGSFNFEA